MKNKYCAYFFIFFFFWIGQRDSSSRNHPYDLLQVFFVVILFLLWNWQPSPFSFFPKKFCPYTRSRFFSLTWPLLKINTYSFLVFFSLCCNFLYFFIHSLRGFFLERERRRKKKKKKKRKSKKKERVKQGRRRKRKARWGEEGETLFFSRKKGLNWEKKTWWKKIS